MVKRIIFAILLVVALASGASGQQMGSGWGKLVFGPAGAVHNNYSVCFDGTGGALLKECTGGIVIPQGLYGGSVTLMEGSLGGGTHTWVESVPDVLTASVNLRRPNALPSGGQIISFATPDGNGLSLGTWVTPLTSASTLDATKLSGNLPAISGASLTGVAKVTISGTSALGTGAISSATCANAVATAATGAVSTDVVNWGFNGDPTGVTGYVPLTTGMLTIIAYPTTGYVNFKVCNNTGASITPGAITLNWQILR